jgi:hypothetical protein
LSKNNFPLWPVSDRASTPTYFLTRPKSYPRTRLELVGRRFGKLSARVFRIESYSVRPDGRTSEIPMTISMMKEMSIRINGIEVHGRTPAVRVRLIKIACAPSPVSYRAADSPSTPQARQTLHSGA